MAKILVVENELDVAKGYKKTLRGLEHTVIEPHAATYRLAWQLIQIHKPDIVLIDIELDFNETDLAHERTGKDLGITINQHYGDVAIIFLSQFDGKALDAWRSTHSIDYMKKAESNLTLERLIEKAIDSKKGESIKITFGDYKHSIYIKDILYIEGNDNHTIIRTKPLAYLPKTEFKSNMQLQEYVHFHFVRVHRGFIINEKHIVAIKGNEIRLAHSEKTIPIGRNFRENHFQRLAKFF